MIINDVLQQLETSTHPVAKALHKGEHFKVLVMGFKKGMVLKEHKTSLPAKLTIFSGKVIYIEIGVSKNLNQYDETDIPVGIVHSVECTEDAICLLTQG
jgi:quercetin dioxygenase-like cupin family protein